MDVWRAEAYLAGSFFTEGGWIAAVGTARPCSGPFGQRSFWTRSPLARELGQALETRVALTPFSARSARNARNRAPVHSLHWNLCKTLDDPCLRTYVQFPPDLHLGPVFGIRRDGGCRTLTLGGVAGYHHRPRHLTGCSFLTGPRGERVRSNREKSELAVHFRLDSELLLWQDPQFTSPDGVSGSLKTEQRHQYASATTDAD